jgi:hypothetical protein
MSFRLPGAVVRRAFVMHTLAIVAVLAAFHLLSQQASFAALGGASVLAGLVLAAGYAATANRVWLTLSSSGMSSVGYTGRRVEFSWTSAVKVVASRRSGYRGHIVAEEGAGMLRSSASAIFIPAAIAASPKFAEMVAICAPAGHPLHEIVQRRT